LSCGGTATANATYSLSPTTSPTVVSAQIGHFYLNSDLVSLGNGDSVAIYGDDSNLALYAHK
jgi:hypothetical protein